MINIYDRINVIGSRKPLHADLTRVENIEGLGEEGTYHNRYTFCREYLISYTRRLAEEFIYYQRDAREFHISIILRDGIKGKEGDYLLPLAARISGGLFGVGDSSIFSLGYETCRNINGNPPSGPYLTMFLKPAFLYSHTHYLEKLSLSALILENEELCDAVLSKKQWLLDVQNLLIAMDKKNKVANRGKFLWTALYLSMTSKRGLYPVNFSTGPATTAQALFKTEDLVSFIKESEDKDYIRESLNDPNILQTKMFKDSIKHAIELAG